MPSLWIRVIINQILKRFNMENCKPVTTPSDPNKKLSVSMSPKTETEIQETMDIPYQEAVGCLLYLAQGTRPDIMFAVNDDIVMQIGPQILIKEDHVQVISSAYQEQQSHGQANDNQQLLSSTEAEYVAASTATNEAIWLKNFASELDKEQNTRTIPIYCDNQSAINLANQNGYNPRTKHIDVRHHHIREKIEEHIIRLPYVPIEEMAADSLTKAVPGPKMDFCFNKMGLSKH